MRVVLVVLAPGRTGNVTGVAQLYLRSHSVALRVLFQRLLVQFSIDLKVGAVLFVQTAGIDSTNLYQSVEGHTIAKEGQCMRPHAIPEYSRTNIVEGQQDSQVIHNIEGKQCADIVIGKFRGERGIVRRRQSQPELPSVLLE